MQPLFVNQHTPPRQLSKVTQTPKDRAVIAEVNKAVPEVNTVVPGVNNVVPEVNKTLLVFRNGKAVFSKVDLE